MINKDFDFQGEVSLEIDSDIKVVDAIGIPMASIVILNLKFFKNSEHKSVPFSYEIEIEGIFGWDEDLEENPEQLETLLKNNSPAILYSYLRPIITTTSVDANLPPLVIPLMDFRKQ